MVNALAEAPAVVEEVFMSGGIPVFWVLITINAIIVAAYLYRRAREKRPLPGPLSYLAQGVFVAVNCLFFFMDDAQRYLNWLTGIY
jgi:hypothetical protein